MSYPPQKKSDEQQPVMNTRLSEKRKERLLNIKKREELKDVLIHKFKEAYGQQSGRRDVISKEVDQFCQRADVTENNLARLERRIQKRSACDDDALSHVSGVSSYSELSRASGRSGASQRSGRGLSKSASAPGVGLPAIDEYKNFEWSRLDDYAGYLHEQDAVRNKMGHLEMQKKLRSDLDKQVADARRKKHRMREEESRYFHNQMVEVEQWKEMEAEKEKEIHAKHHKERTDRDAQLGYEKKRRNEELVKQEAEEKMLVSKIVKEMEQEKLRMAAKKVQQKEAMMRVMRENLEERKIKDAQKDQQVKMEIEGMNEYNRILDLQEAQRASEIEGRLTRQKQLMEKMKAGIVAQQEAKGDEDANRAKKMREEADTRAVEMERNKSEKLQQMRLETQDFLFAQMEEKEARKMHGIELKRLQAKILEEDTKEYVRYEHNKTLAKKRQLLEHRLELDEQSKMKQKDTTLEKFCMSDKEVEINRQLLEVVDKTLKERDEFSTVA